MRLGVVYPLSLGLAFCGQVADLIYHLGVNRDFILKVTKQGALSFG